VHTGIARLARIGPALDRKAVVEYRELPARSLLNRCSSGRVPFNWTINPYRGCEFACRYCYARYTHEFMEFHDPADFERKIWAKRFDAAAFARELRAVKRGEWIAVGTATDPYQPAERRYSITRSILSVLARQAGLRVALTTKSDMVARDAALLVELARRNQVRVNFTVTTMDEGLARLVEPLAPRPELRLRAASKLAAAGVETAVYACPVMPGLNDTPESLEAVAVAARAAGARRFGAGVVFLKPCAQAVFLPFLDQEFPHLAAAYRRWFSRSDYLRDDTGERVGALAEAISGRLGFERNRASRSPEWGQLELFAVDS
jgi:DNA repair photolyase